MLALTGFVAYLLSPAPWQPRFALPLWNYGAAAALAAAWPLAMVWAARQVPVRGWRRAGFAVAAVVALPSSMFAAIAWMAAASLEGDVDTAFEPLDEVRMGASHVRLYRTNCGATCAYGLELREEHEVLPGVRRVRSVWSLYRASEGRLQVRDDTVVVHDGALILGTVNLR